MGFHRLSMVNPTTGGGSPPPPEPAEPPHATGPPSCTSQPAQNRQPHSNRKLQKDYFRYLLASGYNPGCAPPRPMVIEASNHSQRRRRNKNRRNHTPNTDLADHDEYPPLPTPSSLNKPPNPISQLSNESNHQQQPLPTTNSQPPPLHIPLPLYKPPMSTQRPPQTTNSATVTIPNHPSSPRLTQLDHVAQAATQSIRCQPQTAASQSAITNQPAIADHTKSFQAVTNHATHDWWQPSQIKCAPHTCCSQHSLATNEPLSASHDGLPPISLFPTHTTNFLAHAVAPTTGTHETLSQIPTHTTNPCDYSTHITPSPQAHSASTAHAQMPPTQIQNTPHNDQTAQNASQPLPKPSYANITKSTTVWNNNASTQYPKSLDSLPGLTPSDIPIKPTTVYHGEPAVLFSKLEVQSMAAPYKLSLVGKFSFGRPKMPIIRQFFTSLGLKGNAQVLLLDPKHILINLELKEDYSRIWIRQFWCISGCTMRIFKWTTNFRCYEESPIVPVWVSFPFLPIHYIQCKSALISIASAIGKPLRVDHATTAVIRPSVARVLIEYDVSRPPVPRIWIGAGDSGFWQEVIFEQIPAYCASCKHHGHSTEECFLANPGLRKPQRTCGETQATKGCVQAPVDHG